MADSYLDSGVVFPPFKTHYTVLGIRAAAWPMTLASLLTSEDASHSTSEDWAKAAAFVDSISEKRSTRFDDMSKAEIRVDRLRSRGLM